VKRLVNIALFWSTVPVLASVAAIGAVAWYVGRAARRACPAALAIALSACPRPPLASEHRDAFAAVETLWRNAGLPEPGNCLDGARVLVTTRDDFRARCRAGALARCPIELASACRRTRVACSAVVMAGSC
jgi:hypothetical protein